MRRIVITFAATATLTACGQLAYAADLPRIAPTAPIPYPAPIIWTGFYVGAHVGGGWGTKDWTTYLGTAFVDDWQHTVNGYLGGLQAGANYQVGRWVVGVEAQSSWANLEGKNHCAIANRDLNCSTKSDWLGTAALRFGFTAGDALAYIKGGAAWVTANTPSTSLYPMQVFQPKAPVGAGCSVPASNTPSRPIGQRRLNTITSTSERIRSTSLAWARVFPFQR